MVQLLNQECAEATPPNAGRARGLGLWPDLPLILSLVMLTNGLIAPADIGFKQWQPSPYFLVPLLIGCRYGFSAGLLGGGLTAAAIVLSELFLVRTPAGDLWKSDVYFLMSLPLVGAICGEVQRSFRGREHRLGLAYQHASEKLHTLDSELYFLRETKAELERIVATHDSELSTLDSEMRRLFEKSDEEIWTGVLFVLARQTRVSDAAFYRVENKTLRRQALLGSAEHLPETVPQDGLDIARLAIDRNTPVTLPDFWKPQQTVAEPHLMAVPLARRDGQVFSVLVVTGMPFIALNRRSVRLVALICRWVVRIVEMRSSASGEFRFLDAAGTIRIHSEASFRELVQLASETCRDHGLPSSVVVFQTREASPENQELLEQTLGGILRTGDCAAQLNLSTPNVAVLLPLTGERGARIFLERSRFWFERDCPELAKRLNTRMSTLSGDRSAAEVWKEFATDASSASSLPDRGA